MSFLHTFSLSVIQGITEFVPISSSGHLILLPELLGWQDQGLAFDVVVHLGTLFAILVFFWRKLWSIITSFFERNPNEKAKRNRKLGVMILVSIIPAGLVGFLFENMIETTLRSAFVVATSLIFWGIILGLADRYGDSLDSEEKEGLEEISWGQVIFISIAQAIALIPGTSRSGITMTAGLFSNLKRTTAAEFSFLMGIPIIGLAGVLKLWEFYNSGLNGLSVETLTLGFVISAVSGVLAIWGLLKIIKKWSYLPFAFYRVIVGILIFFFII